jgi:transcriptional antiterminator RfaH
MTETASSWYVAKTRPNAETKALCNLERQGFKAYLPRYLRRVSHARKVRWLPRPLFPTYLFVALSPTQQRWRAINSTFGISHLVCHSDRPASVPDGIVEQIQNNEDEDGLVLTGRKIPFEKGAKVNVISGAFADHTGLFECSADDERVVILLDLLGRQVRTRLKLDALTALA